MENPALLDCDLSIPIQVELFDGTRPDATRGVVRNAPVTPAESEAAWADAGPLAWFGYTGDPDDLAYLEYTDPITDAAQRRRVIYRERQSGALAFDTVFAVMQDINVGPQPPPIPGPAHGRPDITGQPVVGNMIVATRGSIADPDGITTLTFPDDFHFQWSRNGVAISGETMDTYMVAMGDIGAQLRVQVTFVDDEGNPEGPLISSPVTGRAAVAPRTDPHIYMAVKPDSDTSEFTPADFLAGFNSATTQMVTATGSYTGQVRIAFALRSDLGPATLFEQHGQPPNERNTLQPPLGDPNDAIDINGGEYFRYTADGSVQGFLLPFIPWELS